jgi:hypothetical protein
MAFLDGLLDTNEVVITILDPNNVPAVSLETLADVLGESAFGITIYNQLAVS